MVEIGFGTEQSAGGSPVDIATAAADVHIVPSGETHQVVIYANSVEAVDVIIKIDGEATGITEQLAVKTTRAIWRGILFGNSSTSAINVDASAATTAFAWAEFRKIS